MVSGEGKAAMLKAAMLKDEFIFPPSPTPYSLFMKVEARRMN